MATTKQKSLKKNVFFNFLRSVMNVIFPIISFPYASRILSPEGIGKVNFANSIVDYFILIAGLGITTYASREAAKIRDDKLKSSQFAREILLFNLISTLFSYLLLIICFIFVDKFNHYRLLICVSATKVLFTAIGMSWIYAANEEYSYIAIRQTSFQIISLILLFTLVKKPEDYPIYCAIGVFANVGANVLNIINSRKYINLFEKTSLNLLRHVKPIFTFFGIQCATKINNVLDAVMLGFLVGDRSVGFYSASTKISRMIIELVTSVISTFMPRCSYYIENNLIDEYKEIIKTVFAATCFFAFPAAAGLFILCEPLIKIFCGEQYIPAIPAMRVLSIGIVGYCANAFLNQVIITPQRKEKFTLISQIICAVFNILFNLFLIKKFDFFGAAIATCCVEFLLPFIILFPSWNYIRNFDNFKSLIKSLLSTICMVLVIYFSFKNIQNDWLKISLTVITGVLVYEITGLFFKNIIATSMLDLVLRKLRRNHNESN